MKHIYELNLGFWRDARSHCGKPSPTYRLQKSRMSIPIITLTASIFVAGCTGKSLDSVFVNLEPEHANYPSYSLPKGMVKLNVKSDVNKDAKTTITITKPVVEFVADPQARFRLKFNYSALADDTFDIQIDKRGLLSSANVINEDKTPKIVESALSIVGELIPLTAGGPQAETTKSIDVAFDPYDPRQVAYSARQIRKAGLNLAIKDVEGNYLYKNNQVVSAYHTRIKNESRHIASQCNNSLCFRTVQPIIIEVFNDSKNIFSRTVLDVPDIRQVSSFDINRVACVKRTNDLKFSDGVLSQVKVEKPSELLGCLSIPASIVKALVGFPS